MKRLFTWLLLLALTATLAGCGKKEETLQIFAMDTVMDFYAVGEGAEETLAEASREINRLESLLSRTRSGSDVYILNEQGQARVSPETEELLTLALQYTAETVGAFDVTIEPLVSAWGVHTETPRVLTADEIAALLPLVGSDHIHMNGAAVTLDAGCRIDLGAIAKGYASDVVARLYREHNIEGGWVSLGGNVYAHGIKEGGEHWSVAIRDPNDTAASAALLELSNEFAVTSGGYQRYFTAEDGTVYQHILNPATGAPAVSDLLSVTVVGKSGTMADAYSTALYVMGEEEAINFWRRSTGEFDVVLITTDHRIIYTPGLTGRITTEEGGPYEVQSLS